MKTIIALFTLDVLIIFYFVIIQPRQHAKKLSENRRREAEAFDKIFEGLETPFDGGAFGEDYICYN